MQLLPGQSVLYNGKETYIDIIYDDGTCTIANPDWDYDDEGVFVREGLDYPIEFWLTVNQSELTPIEKTTSN